MIFSNKIKSRKFKKGITPIIAIVVLLLLTIAVTYSAYSFIQGYFTGLTSQQVEITDSFCTRTGGGTSIGSGPTKGVRTAGCLG